MVEIIGPQFGNMNEAFYVHLIQRDESTKGCDT